MVSSPVLGAKEVAGDADEVADVEKLVELEVTLSHGIQAHVDLQALAARRQMRKAGLPVGADGHHSPRHPDRNPLGAQLLRRRRGIGAQYLRDGVCKVVMARIQLETQLGDGLELFSPLQYEIAKFCCGHGEDPPANRRISLRIKAAIIGLRRKGCQEIAGIRYSDADSADDADECMEDRDREDITLSLAAIKHTAADQFRRH